MKRALSVILTLAMLISMCTVFFVTSVAAATVITNTSPAITADVGEKITLSSYSVVFDGDSAATSNITWKNGDATVTEITPTEKGVTVLTATSGTKTKNIYLVAKNTDESEYVLYEATMANFGSIAAITNAGWTLYESEGTSFTKGSDGSLLISQTGTWTTVTAYLPAWLGEFGDYSFEAEVKIDECQNTGRWFSLVTRSDNRTGNYYYTQMCVRDNNATVANGIELTERHSEAWNQMVTATGDYSTMTDAYRTANIKAFGSNFACYIEGKQYIYVPEATYNDKITVNNKIGHLGLSMCGGTLAIKSVKVTVQESAPEEVPANTSLIYNGYHDADNLINAIANVQRVAPATAGENLTVDQLKGLTVAFFNASDADGDIAANIQACYEAGVVPTIFVTGNAQADEIVAAVKNLGTADVNVMSANTSVLKYIRGKDSRIRTGLRMYISDYVADGTLTDVEADEIRKKVRSAPATYVVIDAEYATKQAVAELQEMALAVWAVVDATVDDVDVPQETQDLEIMKSLTAGVNGIITKNAYNVNNLIRENFEENTITRTPIIIGHRGNPSVAPENTIPSFQAAYDNGADVFEIDVDLTSDGVVVLLHDGTLTRTTTYTGSTHINNMTWAEVQKYNVLNLDGSDSGKPIPTLAEVLNWARGKDIKIFVEFKSGSTACIQPTMELITELGMDQQVDVISFTASSCTYAQTYTPGMSTGLLMSYTPYATSYGSALAQLGDTVEGGNKEGNPVNFIETAQQYNSTVNIRSYSGEVTRDSVQVIADRGLTIWPWTYAKGNTGKSFFVCPDGVTTDNTELVKDMVKLIYAESFTMCEGQTYVVGAVKKETYGNEISDINASETIYKIISGDSVEIKNGRLVAVKEGTSNVMFGYRAYTYDGDEYVLYSQPVAVTVDNDNSNILEPLVAAAKQATVNDYSAGDLETLRKLVADAEALISAGSTDEAAISETAIALAELLDKPYSLEKVNVGTYTTSDPNYCKWDPATQSQSSELHETYIDDQLRLNDGSKSNASTQTAAYSVWQNITVDIIADLGSSVDSDVYTAYFAYGINGINCPKEMTVSYKDTNGDWQTVSGTVEKLVLSDSATWDLAKLTFRADEKINSQYVKLSIVPDGIFVWMDEFEIYCSKGGRVTGDFIYVTEANGYVDNGDSILFTEGTVTATENNHKWTQNIVAVWNDFEQAYEVTEVTHGNGASTPSVKVGDGKIMLAVHAWDTVEGSQLNKDRAAAVTVGQLLIPYGMDVKSAELGIAPYFAVIDSDHVCEASGNLIHDAENHWYMCACGEKVDVAAHSASGDLQHDADNHWYECVCGEKLEVETHTAGDWTVKTPATTESEGLKEKYCTVCGELTDTETIPVLDPEHTHEGIGGWVTDETNHWHICVCGEKVGTAAHEGEWDTLVEAEIGADGLKELRCTECNYLMDTEVIPALPEEDDFVLGDINNNGSVDMTDYILAKRAYFGTYKLTEDEFKRGNVNFNEEMDMTDYILIKRVYFGTYSFEEQN